jgi:hypothetical protein
MIASLVLASLVMPLVGNVPSVALLLAGLVVLAVSSL